METHAVERGWDVYGSDGSKIGRVNRLVLNSQNRHLEQLAVDEGISSRPAS